MASISDRTQIRPLPGCVFENPVVSGTVYVGDAGYNNGGSVSQGNGGATATAYTHCVVVAAPNGGTVATTGDRVDVVVFGRVTGYSGGTANTTAYAGNAGGSIASAAGTVSHKIGVWRDDTTLFVLPEVH